MKRLTTFPTTGFPTLVRPLEKSPRFDRNTALCVLSMCNQPREPKLLCSHRLSFWSLLMAFYQHIALLYEVILRLICCIFLVDLLITFRKSISGQKCLSYVGPKMSDSLPSDFKSAIILMHSNIKPKKIFSKVYKKRKMTYVLY